MLKKWISVSLAICIAVSFAMVSAAADITATVDGFSVSVTAQVAKKGTQPIKCYYVTEDGTISDTPVYMGQSEGTPTPAEVIVGEGDSAEIVTEYIHTFLPFTLDENAPTGTYRVIVGAKDVCDFRFVNKKDKIDVYRDLADADSASVRETLKTALENGIITVDTKTWFDYENPVKEKMDEALADLPLPEITENATDEDIKAFETALSSEIARLCLIAELFTAEEAEFDEAVKNGDVLNLDLKFYNDKELSLSPSAVHSRMEDTFPETFSEEDVQNAFSGAVLLAIVDTVDYGTVTNALAYYDGTCITLTDKADKLSKTEKEDVSTELKKQASSMDSLSDLENAYEDAVDDILQAEEEEEEKPVSRPTGGGGSGGGGGGNTRPGATTGILPSDSTATTPAQTQKPQAVTFTDMDQAPWAAEAVTYLTEKGVLSGRGENTFAPNDLVTREEFVKIITEALHITDETAECDFSDVAQDRWSYKFIASGVNAGLIFGVSETEFAPSATITRQDMAVIVYRGVKLLKLSCAQTADFADSDHIAPYAQEAVSALAGAGIVNGVGEKLFAPNGTVTRAQAAQIIYNLVMANGGIR